MHRLARFLDPRNTIEGKIVSVILSVVLVFSMVNLSAVVENASAAGSDGDALFTTELATDDKAKTQTEGGKPSQNQIITDEQSDTNTPDFNQPSQNNNGVATLSLDDDQNGDESNNAQSTPQKQRADAPAAQAEPQKIILKIGQTAEVTCSNRKHKHSSNDSSVAELTEKNSKITIIAKSPGTTTIECNNTTICIVEVVSNVYLYALKPGGDPADKDLNNNWYGMAQLTANQPSTKYSNGTKLSLNEVGITVPTSFEDITYNGKSYRYAAKGSSNEYKAGYYTIEWENSVSVCEGANAGINNKFTAVSGNSDKNNTFHLDGRIRINTEDSYTVDFMVQQPNENEFKGVGDQYSNVVKKNTTYQALYSDNKVPTIDDYKTINGIKYKFEGWYTDQNCSNLAATQTEFKTSSKTISQTTVFYGKYIEAQKTLSYDLAGGKINGSETIEPAKYDIGNQVTLAGTPTREGYKFVGWKYGDNTYSASSSFTMPSQDVCMVAQWVIDPDQTDDIEAVVDYSLDGVIQDRDRNKLTAKVQVLADHVLSTANVETKEYTGWKLQNVTISENDQVVQTIEPTVDSTTNKQVVALPENINKNAYVVFNYSLRQDLNYTVNYLEYGTNNVLAPQTVVQNQTFDTTVDVNAIAIDSYALIGEQTQQVTISADESQNVINFYYGVDNVSTDPANPGSSDGVPDMYQARVNFAAVNGSVSFPVTYVTLYDADGNYAVDGTGYLTANQIAAATANAGYDQASLAWNVTPSTTAPITSEVTYTATFTATPVAPVVPVTPTPAPVPAGPGAPGIAPGVPTPAAAAAAAPLAAPVATITDEATPLATGETIDDEDTPLAAFDHVDCWVHWLILVGIILTAIYGAVVVRRRLAVVKDVDDLEDEVLDGAVAGATQSAPADNRQAI